MPFGNSQLCIWHVPRTGGMWLQYTLIRAKVQPEVWRLGQEHDTFREYWEYIDHPYQAVIVRDPVDWYSSVFRWFRTFGVRAPIRQWFPGIEREDTEDFNTFLLKSVGNYANLMDQFIPKTRVIRLRTEHLAEDAQCLLRNIGIEFEPGPFASPPENLSKQAAPEVDPELAELIRRTERV